MASISFERSSTGQYFAAFLDMRFDRLQPRYWPACSSLGAASPLMTLTRAGAGMMVQCCQKAGRMEQTSDRRWIDLSGSSSKEQAIYARQPSGAANLFLKHSTPLFTGAICCYAFIKTLPHF